MLEYLLLTFLVQNPIHSPVKATAGAGTILPSTGTSIVFKFQLDNTQCGSSVTSSFPVTVGLNHYYLTSAAGYVKNSSGSDIVFSSDSAGASLISREIESFDYTNGILAAHVLWKCDNATATNDVFYMTLGSSVSQSDSPTTIWANYLAVYHLKDGTTLSGSDSGPNSYTATLTGSTPPSAVAGQIDGAASLDGSTSVINGGNQSALTWNGNSIFMWIKIPACANNGKFLAESSAGALSFRLNNDGGASCKVYYEYNGTGGGYNTQATTNLTTGVWYLVGATFDGTKSGIKLYTNGLPTTMNAQSNTGTITGNYADGGNTSLGWRNGFATAAWHFAGQLDEIRLINKILSADEALATYNNQLTPGNIGTSGFAAITPTVGYGIQSVISQTLLLSSIYATIQGDTNHYTGWSKTGGRVFGQCNDGNCISGASHNFAITELVYDPVTPANTTLTFINTMSGFGGGSQQSTLTGETGGAVGSTWKSYSPFFVNDVLYVNCYRQDFTTNLPYGSGLCMSPDFGAHWCNYGHYLTGGNGGIHTCDSGNWSATGDVPTTTAQLQWPAGSDGTVTNKFVQWIYVQECQGTTVNCPTTTTDNSYFYVMASYLNTTLLGSTLHRCLKTSDPMLPASWTHWDGSTWNSDYTLSSKVFDSVVQLQDMHGAMWSPEYNLYLGFGEDDNLSGTNKIFASKDLKSWYTFATVINTGKHAEWFSPIIALTRTDSGSRKYVMVSNDNTPYAMMIQDLNLGVIH